VRAPAAPGRTIALEGPSGVGKSTLARALAHALGADLLKEAYDLITPQPSLSFTDPAELERLERRLLFVEIERYRRAEIARHAGRTVVLDTGYLGPLTYTSGLARRDPVYAPVLDRLALEVEARVATRSLGLPSVVLYLDLDGRSLARRLSASPDTHPAPWRERHRAVARWERRLWTREFARVAPGRLCVVAADGSPEEVVRRLLDALSGLGPTTPFAGPSAARAVRALAGGAVPGVAPGAPRVADGPLRTRGPGTPG
jgi:thymidylate kinase